MSIEQWKEKTSPEGRRMWTRDSGENFAEVTEEADGTYRSTGRRAGPLSARGTIRGITLDRAIDIGEYFLGVKENECPDTAGSRSSLQGSPSMAPTSS